MRLDSFDVYKALGSVHTKRIESYQAMNIIWRRA